MISYLVGQILKAAVVTLPVRMSGQTTVAFPLGQTKIKTECSKSNVLASRTKDSNISAVVYVPILGNASKTGVVYSTLFIICMLVLTGFITLIVPLFLVKPSS